jgi:type I restriction enzyme S subunit
MVTAKDIHDGRIDYSTARHTTWEAYRNDVTDKSRPRVNDILLTKDGSIGRVAICDRDDICINQSVALLQPNDRIDPRFLKYLLEAPHYQQRMEGDADGTTIKHIYITRVDKMEVAVPQICEQRAIAHILGTLDDKIELNRRMNATLEAITRAIFKSWFVDFDPVRAKAKGRDPGLPKPIADLFPDRFQNSELGEIPAGWEIRSVGSVIDRLPVGKKYEQKTVKPSGKIPVLDQGKSGIIGYHDDEPGIDASVDHPVIVFANHTCYMRLVHFPFSAIQNVLPFVGKGIDTTWAFFATYGKQAFSEYKGHWPDFIILKIVVSKKELTDEFSRTVLPLLKKNWSQEAESVTLAALRGTLLPKLISGDLRVPDAERIIGGHV